MAKYDYILMLFDLYWLRYKKEGDQWYELTDYIRDKLREDGYKINYDDENKDLVINKFSLKKYIIDGKKR